jgi:subfamily B ATP-binding cassette protein MsbA
MTGIMLTRNVPLTVFALSIAPILILLNLHFGRTIRRRATESKQIDTDLTTVIQRAMASMGLILAFGREQQESARFQAAVNRSVGGSMRLSWQENLYPLAMQIVFALAGAVVFGYGGYLVYRDQFVLKVSGGMSVGDIIVFMAYLGQLWDPLRLAVGFFAGVQGHAAAARRVFDVLDQPVAVRDAADAAELPVRPRTLTLQDVRFAYGNGVPALRGIDARIRPGEMVAFVGASGSGKSTVLHLLLRLYDPTGGRLMLDGFDLRRLRLADVRRHFALVPQDTVLFSGTVAENIAYANPQAGMEEIRKAAQSAGAAGFIERLADKYQTRVKEGGRNLSGGQRQRIAVARALLSRAPILLLDEPTSAQDPAHEGQILRTLRELHGKRTIILVTHRLSMVVDCDRILVLDRGRIVERGTHDRLAALRGRYAAMLEGGRPATGPVRVRSISHGRGGRPPTGGRHRHPM